MVSREWRWGVSEMLENTETYLSALLTCHMIFHRGSSSVRMMIQQEVNSSQTKALDRAFFATGKGEAYRPQDTITRLRQNSDDSRGEARVTHAGQIG